jgi:50S ribosomal subunit-associated GTPase HflX
MKTERMGEFGINWSWLVTCIGSGVSEIRSVIQTLNVETVIFGVDLSPLIALNLERLRFRCS